MNVLYGPSIEIDRLDALHDALIARGWRIGHDSDLDENGRPCDPEGSWRYPASFGGVAINKVGDASPYPLTCSFTYSSGHGEIEVVPAGNEEGCEDHRPEPVVIEAGEHELEELAEILDDLEVRARDLDPRVLIECRFFGPCGSNAEHLSTF